jgi:polyhydroxyalkanoate synthesis regulator phasin
MKLIVFFLLVAAGQSGYAEIKIYESTDNTGINKREQIDVIEKYLITLSGQLKSLESKIDSNSFKIKSMETSIAGIKDIDLKKIQDQLSEKNEPEKVDAKNEEGELEKLRADILAVKNNDIESIRGDINSLKFSIRDIQSIIKTPKR